MLVFTVIFLCAIISAFFIVNDAVITQFLKKGVFTGRVSEAAVDFRTLQRWDREIISSALDAFVRDDSIKKIFLRNDRERLYQAAKPLLDDLETTRGITHLYFIRPDGTVFLRVHDKDLYDDAVDRPTLKAAMETGREAYGIELGQTAFALRVAVPYVLDGKVIGYVEMGKEIGRFLDVLSAESGDVYTLYGDKSFVSREAWERVRLNFGASDEWDDLAGYAVLGRSQPVIASDACFNEANVSLAKTGSAVLGDVRAGNQEYACAGFPIRDPSGRSVGAVLFLHDASEYAALSRQGMLTLLATSAVLFVLFFFLVTLFFLRVLVRPVSAMRDVMNEIANGRYDRRVAVRSRDELGEMASAFNTMTVKIQEDIRAIRKSEERYRVLSEALPDSVKVLDKNGRLVHLNRGGLKEHGLKSVEDARKLDYLTTVDAKYVPSLKSALKLALAGKDSSLDVRHTAERVPGASNREWCSMTFSPIKDDRGRISNVLVVSRDISERKRAANRLEAQYNVTRILSESASVEEAAPRILQAVCESAGWSVGEMWRVDPGADVLRFAAMWSATPKAFAEMKKEAETMTLERRVGLPGRIWAKAEPMWVKDVGDMHPLHGAFGVPILQNGAVAAVMNFYAKEIRGPDADLLAMMDALANQIGQFILRKSAEERSRELDDLKNRFIRVVSHQLRTPLSAIRWNLEALLEKERNEPQGHEEIIEVAYGATREIISRVSDLVTAMDIEEGQIRLEKERISLPEMVKAAADGIGEKCLRKRIECTVKVPRAFPTMSGDPARIRLCIAKIMENAVQYTKDGGRIAVILRKRGDRARIEVSDTGIGIPASEQPNIFDRFFRASNAFTVRANSSGLGLYIVKHFIEAHGGSIGFESREGKGSTFWLDLPLS